MKIHKNSSLLLKRLRIVFILFFRVSICLVPTLNGRVNAEENTVAELEILPGKTTITLPKHIPNGEVQSKKSEASGIRYHRFPQTNMIGNQYALYGILIELFLLFLFILLLRRRRENDE